MLKNLLSILLFIPTAIFAQSNPHNPLSILDSSDIREISFTTANHNALLSFNNQLKQDSITYTFLEEGKSIVVTRLIFDENRFVKEVSTYRQDSFIREYAIFHKGRLSSLKIIIKDREYDILTFLDTLKTANNEFQFSYFTKDSGVYSIRLFFESHSKKIRSIIFYRNENKYGLSLYFDKKMRPIEMADYGIDGCKQGLGGILIKGKPFYIVTAKNNHNDGLLLKYIFRNRSLSYLAVYENGNMIGDEIRFDKSGKIQL